MGLAVFFPRDLCLVETVGLPPANMELADSNQRVDS